MQTKHKHHWQTRIFLLCWAAYAAAYFCRVNLSVALPEIGAQYGWSRAALGTIGSSFFWAYAAGQLINGYLGDRVSSRWFIGLGLTVSAIINLCFGFATSLSLMVVLWGLNGFFQSMLWGPIMKTLAQWLPDKPTTQVAIRISTSTIAGYFLAWGLSGYLVTRLSWSWAFWLPSAVVSAFAIAWLVLMRDSPAAAGLGELLTGTDEATVTADSGASGHSFVKIAAETGIWVLALACIAQGVIKDGISLWGPTMLLEIPGKGVSSALLLSLIIPTMNLAGIYLSGWVTKVLQGQVRPAVSGLLAACALAVSGLALTRSSLAGSALLLAGASCFIYGANTLLLTVVPLNYRRYGLTSAVAGTLDAASYLGAAASGMLNGWLADSGGWGQVALIWSAVGLIAALLVTRSQQRLARRAAAGC